jgi:hypothetical protein
MRSARSRLLAADVFVDAPAAPVEVDGSGRVGFS